MSRNPHLETMNINNGFLAREVRMRLLAGVLHQFPLFRSICAARATDEVVWMKSA